MKILFMIADRKHTAGTKFKYYLLQQALSKIVDCKWGDLNLSISQNIKGLYGNDYPDWVLCIPFSKLEQGYWIRYRAPMNKRYKIGAIISDLHACAMLKVSSEGYCEALNRARFDAVLMSNYKVGYARAPYHPIDPDYFVRNLNMPRYLMPWCDCPNLYNHDKTKVYDVTFVGGIHKKQYPLRFDIYNRLPALAQRNKWKFICNNTWFPNEDDLRLGLPVGTKYRRVICQSKILIFGSSLYKYPVGKYFEAMASGTLAMADAPSDPELYHFIPNHNFVEVDLYDWQRKLEYYLTHDKERETIAKRGYETFLKYHTCDIRAKEVIKFLSEHE